MELVTLGVFGLVVYEYALQLMLCWFLVSLEILVRKCLSKNMRSLAREMTSTLLFAAQLR